MSVIQYILFLENSFLCVPCLHLGGSLVRKPSGVAWESSISSKAPSEAYVEQLVSMSRQHWIGPRLPPNGSTYYFWIDGCYGKTGQCKSPLNLLLILQIYSYWEQVDEYRVSDEDTGGILVSFNSTLIYNLNSISLLVELHNITLQA